MIDKSDEIVKKRQIENEAVFRKANEEVTQKLEKFSARATKEGDADLAPDGDMELFFCCECSDENCQERIAMKISTYKELHFDRHNFIVLPGHETNEIEDTIVKKKRFSLVRKFFKPPEDGVNLKQTPTNNV